MDVLLRHLQQVSGTACCGHAWQARHDAGTNCNSDSSGVPALAVVLVVLFSMPGLSSPGCALPDERQTETQQWLCRQSVHYEFVPHAHLKIGHNQVGNVLQEASRRHNKLSENALNTIDIMYHRRVQHTCVDSR